MKGARFKVYQDDAGQWRWRLQSANGRILADSGEGYTRKRAAERAVQTVIGGIRQRYIACFSGEFRSISPKTAEEIARSVMLRSQREQGRTH